MDTVMMIAALALFFLLVYIAILRLQLRAAQQEFMEFKRHVVIVPLPKRKTAPVMWVFAVSVLLLSLALLFMAIR
jgi:hypothetical protein